MSDKIGWHGTTILSVRRNGRVVVAGDGQVSLGNTVIKPNARKVRRLGDGSVIGGFAGATADAFTLFERLERKLEQHGGQLLRAAVELAKDWRTDKYLRNLEAMMIVADKDVTLILTGNGDVLEPEAGIAAIGSGGNYALAAARALVDYEADAETICRKAMAIAAEVCVFTNGNLTIETLEARADVSQPGEAGPVLRSALATQTRLRQGGRSTRMNDALTPKAIVAALDAHIVGQTDAKRAVAVALRNRWRRQKLPEALREEVTPKNILMIGPTGCGKTEISRRLAKLADAPFVKVEATKFTEVGYVGRDVEQIARDLVEEAVRLEKERRRARRARQGRGGGDGAPDRRADRQGCQRGDAQRLPPALPRRPSRRQGDRDRGRG